MIAKQGLRYRKRLTCSSIDTETEVHLAELINMHIRKIPDQAKEKPSSSIPTCMLNYFACMHIYFSQYFPARSIER